MPPVLTPSQDPWDEIRAIKQQLAELSSRSLANAVISQGNLTVDGGEFTIRHPTGGWLVHVGLGQNGKFFFTLRRDDGTAAIELGTTGGGQQFLGVWDRTGHIVMSDDATSGTGLARPWIPLSVGVPVLAQSVPMHSSASYVATWSAGYPTKQQPYMSLSALLRSESGATGNARYTVNGVQVGTVMPIAANSFGWQGQQLMTIPGDIDAEIQVELQVQRTNAVGTVGGVFQGYQRQSP